MDAFDRLLKQQNFEKHAVVISRHWGNPSISVTVNQDKIVLVCDMGAFVDALTREMGHPAMVLTRKQLRERVAKAAASAIEKVKEASVGVMGG